MVAVKRAGIVENVPTPEEIDRQIRAGLWEVDTETVVAPRPGIHLNLLLAFDGDEARLFSGACIALDLDFTDFVRLAVLEKASAVASTAGGTTKTPPEA